MDQLDLARIQFATTSIYHFLFVPVTMGLAVCVAVLHTRWYRTGRPEPARVTRFLGGLLLLSVAVGAASGLVQEFQFGLNWSRYSVFVGDVFGAPLAMEGLAAFFLEATFLGLWWFGWSVLPRRVHLLTAWMIPVGALLSALFIIAANSWMQHPVGYQLDPITGRAQLTSVIDLFTNRIFVWGYLHVVLVALGFGGTVLLSISAWHLRRAARARRAGTPDPALDEQARLLRGTAKGGLWLMLVATVLQFQVGGQLGINETTFQPMKIAAAEANWNTCSPCSFSILQIGGFDQDETPVKVIEVPHLLSLLATGSWDGEVQGLAQLNQQYNEQYGPGYYVPNVVIQYFSMRVMAFGAGGLAVLGLWGGFLLWRRRFDDSRLFLWVSSWVVIAPFAMATAGWLLTESGRQPWLVQGLLLTRDGLSGSGSAGQIITSLVIVGVLYTAIGVTAAVLMIRHARRGVGPLPDTDTGAATDLTTTNDPVGSAGPAVTY